MSKVLAVMMAGLFAAVAHTPKAPRPRKKPHLRLTPSRNSARKSAARPSRKVKFVRRAAINATPPKPSAWCRARPRPLARLAPTPAAIVAAIAMATFAR